MISTPFYKGQGLGNQLANYVTVRTLALDKGFDFGVQFPENFKGKDFMNLDMGLPVIGGRTDVEGQLPQELPDGFTSYYAEQMGEDGDYDLHLKNVEDNTLIHGVLQGIDYIKHRKIQIDNWLKVQPIEMPDDLCVINIRGGEYKYVRDFILPKSYWENGIARMKSINPNMRFEIHTDDAGYARFLFTEYPIISDIGLNWRSIRSAKYLLLSNSSFAILPAWLGEGYVIAPKYFGRFNLDDGIWGLEQNKVFDWNYLDKNGKISKLSA